MNQAPKFFAAKLSTPTQVALFWELVTVWNFSGETAYCRVVSGAA